MLADNQTSGKDEMNATEIRKAVGGKNEVTDAALALGEKRGLVTLRRKGRARLYRIKPEALDPMHMGEDSDLDAGDKHRAGH